jgi:hypothetical protein
MNHAKQIDGKYRVWFDDVVVATKYIGPMKTTSAGAGGGKVNPPPGYGEGETKQ